MNRKYKQVCDSYPELSRVVRNSFLSSVTNSSHKKVDTLEVITALRKFKKKKRLKIIELFTTIKSESTNITDVMPNVVKFFEGVQNIIK